MAGTSIRFFKHGRRDRCVLKLNPKKNVDINSYLIIFLSVWRYQFLFISFFLSETYAISWWNEGPVSYYVDCLKERK